MDPTKSFETSFVTLNHALCENPKTKEKEFMGHVDEVSLIRNMT
jgi:hypothetical protein